MIVGIAENIDDLLAGHESAQRNLVEIRVPRLTNREIKQIITVGMEALGIQVEDESVDQIVEFSANFPYYTHLLCEGAVRSLINFIRAGTKKDYLIGESELAASIDYAIRNTQHTISRAYEDAVRSIRQSQRFKYTLYAIASWPEEPVAYKDICEWVGRISKAEAGTVNISHQLRRLESSGIIRRVDSGFYQFNNPLLKAYVILKARADTTDVELRAIDAQIKQVQKRLDRVRSRI
ncbi:MAG TPA: hypothetical protein VE262_03300 [Blastocatellia bacterium]|nr:hypothetical protein [Blastocatellia bacterium]